MKNLKGKLNEMDYNLPDVIDYTTVPMTESAQTSSTICKTSALKSDVD